MIYIDKYAINSSLYQLHPCLKFGYTLMFMLNAFLSQSLFFSLILMTFLFGFTTYYANIGALKLFKLSTAPMLFVLLGLIPLLFVKSTGHWAAFSITNDSYRNALHIFIRSYASVLALYFLILTCSISQILWFMRKCRIPSVFIDICGLIYRNIFIILGVSQQIYTSQKSRLGYQGFKRGKSHFAHLLGSTFSISIKRATDQYHSIEARCYNGTFETLSTDFDFSRFYLAQFLTISTMLFATNCIALIFNWI